MKNVLRLIMFLAILYTPSLFAADQQDFTTTGDVESKDISEIELAQPILKDAALLQWATNAVKAVNTYDYSNYKQKFEEASNYFAKKAWSSYQKALKKSGNLKEVTSRQLNVMINISQNPILLEQGVNKKNVYYWKVEMPVAIIYQSSANQMTQRSLVTLQINRVRTKEAPDGIAIVEYTITNIQ